MKLEILIVLLVHLVQSYAFRQTLFPTNPHAREKTHLQRRTKQPGFLPLVGLVEAASVMDYSGPEIELVDSSVFTAVSTVSIELVLVHDQCGTPTDFRSSVGISSLRFTSPT